MLGWFNKQSCVVLTLVVNSPLKTRTERGLVSSLLLTFWLGGFDGSYFYSSYCLISIKHHKVNIFKRYRVCFFKIDLKGGGIFDRRWLINKNPHVRANHWTKITTLLRQRWRPDVIEISTGWRNHAIKTFYLNPMHREIEFISLKRYF
jgi:hypothetical protein